MKASHLLIIIAIGLSACGQQNKQSNNSTPSKDSTNWICIAGKQVGEITAQTTEKDLIRIYGKENVVKDSVYQGEGNYEKGTGLFKGTKNEILITWKDIDNCTQPSWIYIRQPNTNWKTNTNITIGTTLKELEIINGKAFSMLGFGWDYSGTVMGWNKGNLEDKNSNPDEPNMFIRFDASGEVDLPEAEYNKLLGDKEFLSSNKSLQKLNPKVREIIIVLNK